MAVFDQTLFQVPVFQDGVAPPTAMPHGIPFRPPQAWLKPLFDYREEEFRQEDEDLLLLSS